MDVSCFVAIAPAAALVSAAAAASSGRGDYAGGAESKLEDFAQRIRQQLIVVQQDSTTLNGLEVRNPFHTLVQLYM